MSTAADPEPVVLGGRIAFGVGQCAEQYPLQPELFAMLHLGDCVIDIGDRDDPHADQPVGCHRAIFLGEPVVVAADHRLVDLVMADVAPEDRPRDHRRKQDLAHPCRRGPAPRRAARGEPVPAASATLRPKGCQVPSARPARRSRKFASKQRLAFDHQRVAAIRQMHRMRSAVAMFLRHPVYPPLRRHFEVPV